MPIPIPPDEAERLQELRRYEIVSTPPEIAFDRITNLAARLFDVPISVLTFVLGDSQWFKSCVGLDMRETSREISICTWAILNEDVMVVPDTRKDDRFACNPLVLPEGGIRFYAGAPLVTPKGFKLGTLCIIDTKPRDRFTTEQKATLEDLAAMVMSELELRVAARTAIDAEDRLTASNNNLEKAALELRRSNEDLAAFAHIASHDLQSPLRTVILYTQLLERRCSDKLNEEEKQYLTFATESAQRMQQLIQDMLQYSQIATPGESRSRAATAGGPLLEMAIQNLAGLIAETDAVVTYDLLPDLYMDPTQFMQVMQNLVANGITYRGSKAPRIHVAIDEESDHWRFSVRDNGMGVNREYFEHIFEPFRRLHGVERAGSGLGLAVCKRIVERAGGHIWVESVEGNGSTFFFTIPKCG